MLARTIRSGDTLQFGDAGEVRLSIAAGMKVRVYSTFEGSPAIANSDTEFRLGSIGTLRPKLTPERGNRIMVYIDVPREVPITVLRAR